MNIRRIIGILLLGCTVLLASLFFYGLFFGPLFAYSPIKQGFDELALDRCTIIYPKGTELPPEYKTVDDLMAETEQFHRLQFKKRVQIIVCASNGQHKRFSLGGGHACTAQTGTVIYFRPSIGETTYPPGLSIEGGNIKLLSPSVDGYRKLTDFLKHELSHAILYQNTSLLKALRIKTWLEEGLAVYFGNSDHYYRGEDLKTLAIDQNFFFDLFDDEIEPENIPFEIKHTFRYGFFQGFIVYLIDAYGFDTVIGFVHKYIQAPKEEAVLFKESFGITQQEALDIFRQRLRE